MKKLEFKAVDIEPPKTEPVEVEMGGDIYVAHCPNDYEFIALQVDARKMESDPSAIDLTRILAAFFDRREAELIDMRMRGANARISLVGELIPCVYALMAHYKEEVTARLEDTQKKVSSPKGE